MSNLWTQWRRRWRFAETRLMFFALILSVTSVTSVGFVTDRVMRAMEGQATELQGGDLVVTSQRPMSPDYLEKAAAMGLQSASVIRFPSMASADGRLKMSFVKAVSEKYPLKGKLRIVEKGKKQSRQVFGGPTTGMAWVEPRLLTELGVKLGDPVQLGHRQFTLTAAIEQMPDQGVSAFQFAPVILINRIDLESTGLLTPASRARFTLLFSGTEQQTSAYKSWIKPELKLTERIRTMDDGLPAVQQAFQRAQRFLALASLLSVILAGSAIALTSHSLVSRESREVAMLKTMGAVRSVLMQRIGSAMVMMALLAALFGSLLGYLVQLLLSLWVTQWLGLALPAPGMLPFITGVSTAVIMTLAFSAPYLLPQIRISPLEILQKRRRKLTLEERLLALGAVAGVFLLMWLQSQQFMLSLMILAATLAALGLLAVAGSAVLYLLKRLATVAPRMHILLPRDSSRFILLVVVFGAGIFSLLLLSNLHGDLIKRWSNSLPADAPNHFLINIHEDNRQEFSQTLEEMGLKGELFPMTRGRLVAINERNVSIKDYSGDRAKRLLEREFNLSSAGPLPRSNRIVSGSWFNDDSSGLSVEKGIAETFGIKLGDKLRFDIAGITMVEPVVSIRRVRWDSLQPNFFVVTAPGRLATLPKTYITSIHIPADRSQLITDLIKVYPEITDIDISIIMGQVRGLIDKATLAVQAIFSLTLISGLLVLYAALQSQRPSRRKEIAILKSLGARRSQLRRTLLFEFALLGGISGLLAALFAMGMTNLLAYRLFELDPELNFPLLAIGVAGGALLVGVAGYLNVKPLLRIPPVILLQESSQ